MTEVTTEALNLRVMLPTQELIDTQISKVIAEAPNGHFCLLPRHIDFVAALVPGVVSYFDLEGREFFVGVDEGILVKLGKTVTVSTANAVTGTDLQTLRNSMKTRFTELEAQEQRGRSALARLESATLRQFWETREYLHD